MQALARWLGGAKKVAPLLALLAAGLAALAALGLAASAASAATFSNNNGITINDGVRDCDTPGPASPYPSEIAVSGLGSSVSDVNVTVSGLGHNYPADIGLLLVSPAGQSVILMSDSGGNVPVSGIDLTFDDAASGAVPRDGPLTSGTFLPGQGPQGPYRAGCLAPASFPEPAPASPYGSSLSVFNGTNPNGTWKLYVIDDTVSDTGSIGGWSLEITAVTSDTTAPSVSATSPPADEEGVSRATNVKATFSEAMKKRTINSSTFTLKQKGATTNVATTVLYSASTHTATLKPEAKLAAGSTYVATVSTQAKDEAGNRLDQDPATAGTQKASWKFTTVP